MAADPMQSAASRDGAWLLNGVKQYQRWTAHEEMSEKDALNAQVALSYVCAVVDLEKYLVLRANLLGGAVGHRPKLQRLSPERLKGMSESLPILVPLMQTPFSADSPSCDRVMLMVRGYLDTYPEMLDKGAEAIVEKALLDEYSKSQRPDGGVK